MNKWRFVSNQNASLYGINDAGIETFSANTLDSLVREVIQNSLDAQLNLNKPVVVKFNVSCVKNTDLPDYEGLKSVMEKCRTSNEDDEAVSFFNNALNTMYKDVKCLKMSDYNTTGLIGADTGEKGSVWSRLIKENGSSQKSNSSGGSFGIGKAAPFAASDLRAVIYSSLDKKGVNSCIGVAKLVSFKEDTDGYWTTGTGYYSEDKTFSAIIGSYSLGNESVREEPGTDIYVLGFRDSEDSQIKIIQSVLNNFLVSLWKGKLVFSFGEIEISQKNLGTHISSLNKYDNDETRDTINYYNLLTGHGDSYKKIVLNNSEYGKKYGFPDGSCTLFLMEGTNLNSRVMMTRQAGMKLFNQSGISGTIDFTGILMIEGDEMNKEFKKMEVPSHDSWQPGRCKSEETFAHNIYKDLRAYLRTKVKECFAIASEDRIDAFGAGDFLPDFKKDEGSSKESHNSLLSELKGVKTKVIKNISDNLKVDVSIDIDPDGKEKREGKNKGKKGKKNGGTENGIDKGFKYLKIDQRLICISKSNGKYLLKFITPNNSRTSFIDLITRGEQADYSLKINGAKIIKGSSEMNEINNNRMYLKNNLKSDVIEIEIDADINQYVMMEAKYYEKKR